MRGNCSEEQLRGLKRRGQLQRRLWKRHAVSILELVSKSVVLSYHFGIECIQFSDGFTDLGHEMISGLYGLPSSTQIWRAMLYEKQMPNFYKLH